METKRLNILHLTNTLGMGGVEKIIYQICQVTQDEFGGIYAASTGGVFADKLEYLGVKHYKIPDLSTNNLQDIIKIIKTIKKIIKENNVDIIHCHHRMAVFYAKLLFPVNRIIYNNHTIYSDKAFFSHFVLNHIQIIADGIQAKRNVTDYFKVSEKNVTVINNAVDEFDGEIRTIPEMQREREKGKFIVVNSSRFHPQKGLEYFIDAAKKLMQRNCNIAFFVVGDGPLHDEIVEQVHRLQMEEHIHFLGFRNDIKNVIVQSDVLVLASVYEGLPLTPMEAFSVHRAVIATDIDGTREVVQDHFNGILVRTKDPESIADGIYEVYQDRKLLEQLSEKAYCSYCEKFNLQSFRKSYLEFYQKIQEYI